MSATWPVRLPLPSNRPRGLRVDTHGDCMWTIPPLNLDQKVRRLLLLLPQPTRLRTFVRHRNRARPFGEQVARIVH
jgi:hypothetical protein